MERKKSGLIDPLSLDRVFSCLPGVIFWQDLNFIIHGSNDTAAKVFGFKSPDLMVGKTPWDFRAKSAECASEYMELNKKSTQTKQEVRSLIVDTFADDQVAGYIVKKFPIIDKGSVVGILTQGLPLNSKDYLLEVGIHVSKLNLQDPKRNSYCYTVDSQIDDFNLSERESVCLFYFVRGKTTREIANILSLSPRTIEFHIDKIKGKMNCRTKTELIEKAIENGYMSFIPKQLLSNRLVLVF